ncbi:MAG TPA: WXG100 family type VII secretion target [Ktedonobacteraceae bacterium]|nr:WXG100 family type VII secretion target [Ktedonobacteraceae bacterium]
MAENVSANYSDMQSAASQFNQHVTNFEQALSQISTAVSNLQSTWVGSGSESFATIMTQWNSDVTKLNNLLQEISTTVNQAVTSYSDTDTSVSQGFKKFG